MPTLVKKDGSRVEYSREKIISSMRLALRKRPVSSDALDEAIAHLEERVISLGEKEIPTSRVGEMVMRELKRLDKVGYIRYASVYRSFEDIESFETALKELNNDLPKE
jgi:transcriptional repressor NrdR